MSTYNLRSRSKTLIEDPREKPQIEEKEEPDYSSEEFEAYKRTYEELVRMVDSNMDTVPEVENVIEHKAKEDTEVVKEKEDVGKIKVPFCIIVLTNVLGYLIAHFLIEFLGTVEW